MTARANRLSEPSSWGCIEFAYVAAIAFLIARIESGWLNIVGYTLGEEAIRAANQDQGNLVLLSALFSDPGVVFRSLSSIPLLGLGVWLLAHHLYRVTCSRLSWGEDAPRPWTQLHSLVVACFAGCLLAEMSSATFLSWLTTIPSDGNVLPFVTQAAVVTVLVLFHSGPVAWIAYFGLGRAASHKWIRLFGWTWWWLVLSIPFSVAIYFLLSVVLWTRGTSLAAFANTLPEDRSAPYLLVALAAGTAVYLTTVLFWRLAYRQPRVHATRTLEIATDLEGTESGSSGSGQGVVRT